MIPKRIYIIWISDKPLPEQYAHYTLTWKNIMPEYEYVYITLEKVKQNRFLYKLLAEGNYILVNHYVRLKEIYDNGGIYMDLDVEVIKKFDSLLDNKMFLGWEDSNYVNNAVFGAEAGHPFIKKCLEYMENIDLNTPEIELETGPRMFTNVLKNNLKDVKQLSPSVFYPYHYTQTYSPDCIKSDTLAIHHWSHSWKK